ARVGARRHDKASRTIGRGTRHLRWLADATACPHPCPSPASLRYAGEGMSWRYVPRVGQSVARQSATDQLSRRMHQEQVRRPQIDHVFVLAPQERPVFLVLGEVGFED